MEATERLGGPPVYDRAMPDPQPITVRAEQAADRPAVHAVNEAAFDTPAEADLIDALRGTTAWLPELSLVAEQDGEIVGHLLLSLVDVDGTPTLSLAPMAVRPDRQRAGIGTALVTAALERARTTSYPHVVVLGHPAYYPRFGFAPARAQGIETPYDVPDAAWMALPLPGPRDAVRGTVRYPPAFDAV